MFSGLNSHSFDLKIDSDWFKKGDILKYSRRQLLVTKVYKFNIWRKILLYFGFKVKLLKGENLIRVKSINLLKQ